jgi:hypothetical protein
MEDIAKTLIATNAADTQGKPTEGLRQDIGHRDLTPKGDGSSAAPCPVGETQSTDGRIQPTPRREGSPAKFKSRADHIRHLLQNSSLSQAEIAQTVGCSEPWVSSVRSRVRRVDVSPADEFMAAMESKLRQLSRRIGMLELLVDLDDFSSDVNATGRACKSRDRR